MTSKTLKKWFPLFLLPTLLAFLIGFVIPFLMGLYLSFCEYATIEEPTFVGFANYFRVFTADSGFLYSLGFTALFTLVSVVLINGFGFAVALALSYIGLNLLPVAVSAAAAVFLVEWALHIYL